MLAQESCAWTPLWSERGSRSYHLSEQAAPGFLPPAALVHPWTSAAPGFLPPAALVHPWTSQVQVHENQPGPG